jgi:hypothetical protein
MYLKYNIIIFMMLLSMSIYADNSLSDTINYGNVNYHKIYKSTINRCKTIKFVLLHTSMVSIRYQKIFKNDSDIYIYKNKGNRVNSYKRIIYSSKWITIVKKLMPGSYMIRYPTLKVKNKLIYVRFHVPKLTLTIDGRKNKNNSDFITTDWTVSTVNTYNYKNTYSKNGPFGDAYLTFKVQADNEYVWCFKSLKQVSVCIIDAKGHIVAHFKQHESYCDFKNGTHTKLLKGNYTLIMEVESWYDCLITYSYTALAIKGFSVIH